MVVKFYVLLILEVSSIDLLNLKSFSKIRDVSAGEGRGCKMISKDLVACCYCPLFLGCFFVQEEVL